LSLSVFIIIAAYNINT